MSQDQGDPQPKTRRRESILRHRQVPGQEEDPPIKRKNRRVSFRNVMQVQFFDTDKRCPNLLHNSSPKKEKINETLGSDGVMTPGRGTSSDNSNHSFKDNTMEIFGEAAKKPVAYVPPEESTKLVILEEQNDTLEMFQSPAPTRKKPIIISPIAEDNFSPNRTSHASIDMSLEFGSIRENETMQMFDSFVVAEKSIHSNTMDIFTSIISTPVAENRNNMRLHELAEIESKQVQTKIEALKKELEFSKQKCLEQEELARVLKAAKREKGRNEMLILRKMGGRTNSDDTRDFILPDDSMTNDNSVMSTC